MWHTILSLFAIQSTIRVWMHTSYNELTRVYVTVNAYRALFPVKIIERTCLTSISNPFLDRTLATIGEVSFAHQLSTSFKQPCIFNYAILAQVYCWTAMLTRNNKYHLYEETLWLMIGHTCHMSSTRMSYKIITILYCSYMIFVDIPKYADRYASNPPLLLWHEGLEDSFHCIKTRYGWEDEKMWRFGYFVGASELSMYLN